MTFYLNPAENKPQFVQGEEKNIESSLKRMHLLNKSGYSCQLHCASGERSLACYWCE